MPPRGSRHEFRRRERAVRFKRAKWLAECVIRSLGAQCATCGEVEMSLLTVDHHPRPVTYDRYALRYDARVARYIEELVAGVGLRCLCMVCNGRFGQLMQMAQREPGEDEDERVDNDLRRADEADESTEPVPF